jgi:hypothetical protein
MKSKDLVINKFVGVHYIYTAFLGSQNETALRAFHFETCYKDKGDIE